MGSSPRLAETKGYICNGESVCLKYNRSWVQGHGRLKPKAIYVMVSVCHEYNRSWVQAHGRLKPKAIYVMVSVCLEYNRSWVQAHGRLKPKAIYVMVRVSASSTTDHWFKPTVG